MSHFLIHYPKKMYIYCRLIIILKSVISITHIYTIVNFYLFYLFTKLFILVISDFIDGYNFCFLLKKLFYVKSLILK